MLTLECKEGLSYYPGKPHKTQTLEVVCQGELDTGLARFVKKNSTSPLPYCQKECYSNGDCHPNFSMCSNGKFYLFKFDVFWYIECCLTNCDFRSVCQKLPSSRYRIHSRAISDICLPRRNSNWGLRIQTRNYFMQRSDRRNTILWLQGSVSNS